MARNLARLAITLTISWALLAANPPLTTGENPTSTPSPSDEADTVTIPPVAAAEEAQPTPTASSGASTITQMGEVERALLSSPLTPSDFYFETVVTGLSQPVLATNAGDGSGRIFVVEQAGRIRIIKNGVLLGTPFLEIVSSVKSGGEQGLLALAFHPSYETNGFFYVMYTASRPANTGDTTGSVLTLKRFSVSANADLADAGSGLVLLTIDHPAQGNHNGGTLAFGPDGYLYWSTGDGGGGGDPYENAQDLSKMLGKILRLDVDSATPYAIPADNPFVESPVDDPATLAEIWAYGVRNPWRISFDRLTGDLYIGDVGQGLWEEIDFQPASSAGGENYGWDMYEGNAEYNPPNEGPYDPTGKVFPVAVYAHGPDCSVNGGHVYRGTNFPSLSGHYFYGDYCSAIIRELYYDVGVPGWVASQVMDLPYSFDVSSLGEDEDGNLYIVLRTSGSLLRIGYQDPLAFAGVQPTPADGSSACTTPTIGADLLLSDATRTGAGGFDPSKVKLRLDGTDVTASARVRVTLTQPASHATLLYTPPSAIALGAHMATLTYASADGPLTAAWDFSVTSGPCPTSAQQLSDPVTATAEEQTLTSEQVRASAERAAGADAPPESAMVEATAAATEAAEAETAGLATEAEVQPSAAPATSGSRPTATLAPLAAPEVFLLPGSVPGCLPQDYSCALTIRIKP